MSIQKKSLISSLNATKKANVAISPATGTTAAGAVKPAVAKLAKLKPAAFKPGMTKLASARPASFRPGVAKLATLRAGKKN